MNPYENLSKEEMMALLMKKDDEIERLYVKNRELNEMIDEFIAKYEIKVSKLKQKQVEMFIPKSESLKDEDRIVNEIEVNEEKEKKTRKSPTQTFLNDLKETFCGEAIVLDYDFDANGIERNEVKEFGEDVTYKIEIEPIHFEVKKYVKKKYKNKDTIYEATLDDPFPHSPLTDSLAANIINMKFSLGVPFYRYGAYLRNNGLNFSDATITHWASMTMQLLEPLYERLLHDLVNTKVKIIHGDESPLNVIDSEKEKCYMFVYTTSKWEKPIRIYDFVEGRSTSQTKDILKGFSGVFICDGYKGYDSLPNDGIQLQRCMVHARRYFFDVIKGLDKESQKKSPAYKAVQLFDVLFGYEDRFHKKEYLPSQIKNERNKPYYKKSIKELNDYIDSLSNTNNEDLLKAVNYYNNHKAELYTYLENGYVDMHNNLAERDVVKPFVVARKGFMFCKTVEGAKTTAKLFSIVQSAKANGLDSEKYLAYVIRNINKKPIDELVPWCEKLPKELQISLK